jgi:hypothetical protein
MQRRLAWLDALFLATLLDQPFGEFGTFPHGHHPAGEVAAKNIQNCSKGVSGVNDGSPYCPNLAELGETGLNYLETSTSRPSDSFPGLMALMTGGSPRTYGAFYDVAYDRVLAPPMTTTGNGLAGGTCSVNTPNGTTTEYDEGIDKNQTFLNGIDGISTANGDGGINSIDPSKLVHDPYKNCAPVYPWNFVRTNTIFGVTHAAGGYTAWSDKHPSYSAVSVIHSPIAASTNSISFSNKGLGVPVPSR